MRNSSAFKEGFMEKRWIDVVLDVAELTSLAAFVTMIGFVARAFGA
jgi:hypothetical protein